MPSLQEVKEYLKIDFDDDDNLINSLIKAADLYLKDAIHKNYDKSDERAKMLSLMVIDDMYNNSGLTEKVQGTTRRLVSDFSLQLKLKSGVGDEV